MIENSSINIRTIISELEKQIPKNIKEFEFRESEIKRYLDLLINGEIK